MSSMRRARSALRPPGLTGQKRVHAGFQSCLCLWRCVCIWQRLKLQQVMQRLHQCSPLCEVNARPCFCCDITPLQDAWPWSWSWSCQSDRLIKLDAKPFCLIEIMITSSWDVSRHRRQYTSSSLSSSLINRTCTGRSVLSQLLKEAPTARHRRLRVWRWCQLPHLSDIGCIELKSP